MKRQDGKHEGDLLLSEDLALHGMVTGNLTVHAQAKLLLHGMCCGNLIIAKDGVAEVFGTVVGSIINEGGTVFVAGTVQGFITTTSGTTDVDPNARVGGGILRR